MSFFGESKPNISENPSEIHEFIDKWRPRACKTEKDFELSLYEFLHQKLGDTQITKQYARGRIRADIVVAEKVIIELKTNLDSTGKFQRLIGQLTGYESWEGIIVVVLTGDTDKNLLKELRAYVEKVNEKYVPVRIGFFTKRSTDGKFFVVEK